MEFAGFVHMYNLQALKYI